MTEVELDLDGAGAGRRRLAGRQGRAATTSSCPDDFPPWSREPGAGGDRATHPTATRRRSRCRTGSARTAASSTPSTTRRPATASDELVAFLTEGTRPRRLLRAVRRRDGGDGPVARHPRPGRRRLPGARAGRPGRPASTPPHDLHAWPELLLRRRRLGAVRAHPGRPGARRCRRTPRAVAAVPDRSRATARRHGRRGPDAAQRRPEPPARRGGDSPRADQGPARAGRDPVAAGARSRSLGACCSWCCCCCSRG